MRILRRMCVFDFHDGETFVSYSLVFNFSYSILYHIFSYLPIPYPPTYLAFLPAYLCITTYLFSFLPRVTSSFLHLFLLFSLFLFFLFSSCLCFCALSKFSGSASAIVLTFITQYYGLNTLLPFPAHFLHSVSVPLLSSAAQPTALLYVRQTPKNRQESIKREASAGNVVLSNGNLTLSRSS